MVVATISAARSFPSLSFRKNSSSKNEGMRVTARALDLTKLNVSTMEMPINGMVIKEKKLFRQYFPIRSFEIGPEQTAPIGTLVKYYQETSINYSKGMHLFHDGYGSTHEMAKRDLIWVTTKMEIVVERYPFWGDIVQVDTWFSSYGKIGIGWSSHICDCQTGQTILRSNSVCVMMNKVTRRLSKVPEEVWAELGPYLVEDATILNMDVMDLAKISDDNVDGIESGLKPQWTDLDVNNHVNYSKYIGWLLQSISMSVFEQYEITGMILKIKKECQKDSVLQSLTKVSTLCDDAMLTTSLKCGHLLRLESGDEIARGRTTWRAKHTTTSNIGNMDESQSLIT